MSGKRLTYNSYIDLNSQSSKTNVSFSGKSNHVTFLEDVTKVKVGVTHKRYTVRGVQPASTASRPAQDLSIVNVTPEAVECIDDVPGGCLTLDGPDIDSDDEMMGKNMFMFRTPKRSKQSAKSIPSAAAAASAGKRNTQRVTCGGTAEAQDTENTSLPGSRTRLARKVKATTPYRLTSRMDVDADSDDSVESEDSNLSFTDAERAMAERTGEANLPNMSEQFFNAQSSKPVTSDHTLARLREDGVLDQTSLSEILQSRSNRYKKGVRQLHEQHSGMYRSWMLQLCLGFNLLLYGYGSKKHLIEEFRKTCCSQYHCVVINGFFPSLTLRSVLAGITDCLQITCTHMTDSDAVVADTLEQLDSRDEALFIFVHNIDGPMLRNSSTQHTLACLAASQNVHVVASLDHINAPLMWNQNTVTKYRWLWYDATTFEPYIEETSYENSLMTQQSSTLALRSILNVFKSLTPNARKIFQLMVKYHLDNVSSQSYIGIPFQMLYQKCRESFLVNSDQTLRSQLTEFRDHKLIKSRKGVDGAEHIFLPTDVSTLNDFLEQIENVEA